MEKKDWMGGHGLIGGHPSAIGGCVSKSERAWSQVVER